MYEKQNFKTGQVLTAEALNHIEDGIVANERLNTTYEELVSLRNNQLLTPGRFYRITDYETTTMQEGTQSAGKPFDVIVLALSRNELSADAWAAHSSRDTVNSYGDRDLSAWRLKYCLDNDRSRFAWACPENGEITIVKISKYGYNGEAKRVPREDHDVNGETLYAWKQDGGPGQTCWIKNDPPLAGVNVCFNSNGVEDTSATMEVTITTTAKGKGVIYQLRDENSNQADFDHSNILFKVFRCGDPEITEPQPGAESVRLAANGLSWNGSQLNFREEPITWAGGVISNLKGGYDMYPTFYIGGFNGSTHHVTVRSAPEYGDGRMSLEPNVVSGCSYVTITGSGNLVVNSKDCELTSQKSFVFNMVSGIAKLYESRFLTPTTLCNIEANYLTVVNAGSVQGRVSSATSQFTALVADVLMARLTMYSDDTRYLIHDNTRCVTFVEVQDRTDVVSYTDEDVANLVAAANTTTE